VVSVDFNELPEFTRNRFIAATRSPVARFPSSTSSVGWGVLLGVALIPLLAVLMGSLTASADAWRGVTMGPIIALLAFFAILGGLGIGRVNAVRAAHPFVLGTYLFPTQIVVAESRSLLLHPLTELINVAIVNRYVNGGYQGSSITCTFKTGPGVVLAATSIQEAHRVRDALAQGQETLATALARRDYESLRPLDPLFEAQMTSFAKVNEPGPLVQPLAKWTEDGPRALMALGSALALTGLVFMVRLVISLATPDPAHPTPATRPPPATSPAKKKPATR
jgi:hypothetical protein